MARDPGSVWKPLVEAGAPDGHNKTQLIVHSTGTLASAANNWKYFQNANVVVESTFIIGLTSADPTLQIMDSTDRADANGSANNRAISIEVVGDGVGAYTPWQIQELIRIGKWAAATHPIEKRIIPSEAASGFGWHVMFGAPGPWTSVRGKVCPGNARIKQLKEVVFPAIFAPGAAHVSSDYPVRGAIATAYNRVLHGMNGANWGYFLGKPLGPEAITWGRDGYWQPFTNGAIYAHNAGAYVMRGDILKRWRAIGSEVTTGYPITDETSTPDTRGRYNHFANKWSIYWSPETGAWEVHGWFRDWYEKNRWEAGPAGYPTSGEYIKDGGVMQNFQGGKLRLHPNVVEWIPN